MHEGQGRATALHMDVLRTLSLKDKGVLVRWQQGTTQFEGH